MRTSLMAQSWNPLPPCPSGRQKSRRRTLVKSSVIKSPWSFLPLIGLEIVADWSLLYFWAPFSSNRPLRNRQVMAQIVGGVLVIA